MLMKLRYTLFLLFCLSVGTVFAQEQGKGNEQEEEKKEVKFEVRAPEQVKAGEQFRLMFVLTNADVKEIDFPDKIKGFDIIYGPAISTSSTIQVIEGKRTSSTSVAFTYTLAANQTGKLRIPEASVTVGGKKYTTESPRIEVLSSRKSNKPTVKEKEEKKSAGKKQKNIEIKDKDAFIQTFVEKQEIDDEKVIEVTLRVYISDRVDINGIHSTPTIMEPDFSEFRIIRSWTPRPKKLFKTEYEGKSYYAADIRKFLLLPKRSGKIEIKDAGYIDIVFGVKTGETEESFFGTVEKQIEVKKTLTVKPFTIDAGLVGDWHTI